MDLWNTKYSRVPVSTIYPLSAAAMSYSSVSLLELDSTKNT